jgi:hypothetical protein
MIALLESIRKVVCIKDTVYTNMEDERLATAALAILTHGRFEERVVKSWLNSFTQWDKTEAWHEEYKVISNIKNFLSALYFRMTQVNSQENLAEAVMQVRNELLRAYI